MARGCIWLEALYLDISCSLFFILYFPPFIISCSLFFIRYFRTLAHTRRDTAILGFDGCLGPDPGRQCRVQFSQVTGIGAPDGDGGRERIVCRCGCDPGGE